MFQKIGKKLFGFLLVMLIFSGCSTTGNGSNDLSKNSDDNHGHANQYAYDYGEDDDNFD